MGKYQTEQKKMLLAFFMSHKSKQYSAEEVASVICFDTDQKGPGKSTVYRLIAEMEKDGLLRRFAREDGKRGWLYQYHEQKECAGHLHLKCTECGALLHLECAISDSLLTDIESKHQFRVDNRKSVLFGLCRQCSEKREEKHA